MSTYELCSNVRGNVRTLSLLAVVEQTYRWSTIATLTQPSREALMVNVPAAVGLAQTPGESGDVTNGTYFSLKQFRISRLVSFLGLRRKP